MARWDGLTPRQWVEKSKDRVEAVYKTASQKVADRLSQTVHNGGRLPHKTGNLMRSLLASTSAMPTVSTGPFQGQDVGLVIAQLDLGQVLYIGYQANYARRLNYGFKGADSLGRVYNHEGFNFVEDAQKRWPNYVKEAIREVAGA